MKKIFLLWTTLSLLGLIYLSRDFSILETKAVEYNYNINQTEPYQEASREEFSPKEDLEEKDYSPTTSPEKLFPPKTFPKENFSSKTVQDKNILEERNSKNDLSPKIIPEKNSSSATTSPEKFFPPSPLEKTFPKPIFPPPEPQEITIKMPKGNFEFPLPKTQLKATIRINFYIEQAQSVEFYLRRPEALIEFYLGKATKSNENNWVFLWDTRLTPNGTYHLKAKVTNEYGIYEGGDIIVYVFNPPLEKNIDLKTKEHIEKKFKEIEDQKTKIEKEKKLIKEQAEKKIEELVKTQEPFLKDKEEKKKELQQNAKEISEKLKRVIETKDEREILKLKNEVLKLKKELPKDIERLAKPIKESVLPQTEEKAESPPEIKENQKRIAEFKKKSQQELEQIVEKIEKVSKEHQNLIKKKQELKVKDSDGDGLPDFEELRIGTNPLDADSDNDGFTDAMEFKEGFDPLSISPADKIQYQDPRKVKLKPSPKLKVEKIETIKLKSGKAGLKLKGKSLPFSFVTIYVFSLPIVVVTRADAQGNWEYVLDKPLSDGEHIAYVTLTNNRGEIKETSEALSFIKSGENIIQVTTPSSKEKAISPAQALQKSFFVLTGGIIVFAIGLALIIISLVTSRKNL